MPGELLAGRMHVPRDLPLHMTVAPEQRELTPEQTQAVERREGDLFLDAGAGSGKTSVLVERFVRSVLEDEIDVAAILTITFTEKAAAEMRERIRVRLRELGAFDEARATEGAFISTIHGFCARMLRANALTAGVDPAFVVLDELGSTLLADQAFEGALQTLAEEEPAGVELISAYGAEPLRAAIKAIHGELRSRGQSRPRLPEVLEPEVDPDQARRELEAAAAAAAAELGAIADPATKVAQALSRIERCGELAAVLDPWPGDLDGLRLPSGNGAALTTPVCTDYREALDRFIGACARRGAVRARDLLDRLLDGFGARYTEHKRSASAVDFEDLELLCRDLLRSDPELRERYRDRFVRVMVDELQDTNAVQLELIDAVSSGNLFTVGDAQQSIYAFRHADVELFERRGAEAGAAGARATLRTNFRSRPEILAVVNRAFERVVGEGFLSLSPGRAEPAADESLVELLITDKGADWASDGLAAPWRVAEAAALARRIGELIDGGAAPRDVVVLVRATTDMRAYERALEERGIPTYVIGGRGYWSHPQVVDLVAYLQTLANPRDELALYSVLASPLVGASVDALVLLAAASRASGRDPWRVLGNPEALLEEVSQDDSMRLARAAAWLRSERLLAARLGVEELVERALEHTGYDLELLAMPGGQRRLANVRKLMRLGREHEAAHGPDLRGFLELVRMRAAGGGGDPHESEAPLESEALDAVRIMTIHRAKGLEFEIVCVADLGRGPRWPGELIRVGRDGRLGLRLARPGTGRPWPALSHDEIGEQQRAAAAAEERRLFYVAMTRARERLILSGAANLGGAWTNGATAPIGWLAPALVPDVSSRVEEGSGVAEGVRFTFVTEADADAVADREAPIVGIPPSERPGPLADAPPRADALPRAGARTHPQAPVGSLSYTSLSDYLRCGYRFYVQRVLGVPGAPDRSGGTDTGTARGGALDPAERGSAVHALLERLDFRRPLRPIAEAIASAAARAPSDRELAEIAALIERFAASPVCSRLGRATRVRREQPFGFLLGETAITGALDVIAAEPGDRMLVVDYKTDRLGGADPAAVVEREYGTQRLIYALAALREGGDAVEVVHVFLEAPEAPVTAVFMSADEPELERQLRELSSGVLRGEFRVTDVPRREICHGCPAEGGLCSWPLEMTRREAPDTLF